MSAFVYIISYASIIVFIIAVITRINAYVQKPIHVRWELYPVAHEGGERASYGGSYLEDVDWWKKERKISRISELKYMIPEILFLKACWEHNRSIWYRTYTFHLGLYVVIGFIGLLIVGAVGELTGTSQSGAMIFVNKLSCVLGPVGFVLSIIGALGLIIMRSTDTALKNYSSSEHFYNLWFFIIAASAGLLSWFVVDKDFSLLRGFVANLLTFEMGQVDSRLFAAGIVLPFLLIAYIPNTHMAHFFMKYFLYHDIRWGDEPNINNPATDAKIGVVLNYPVTWAASHIAVTPERKTWAEVATFNPAAEPETEKE
ncbi:MAG: nitrate reductase [Desulfobacterales bacterium]|nr:nitrate reductase [Desulfobacterales bacterium]